MSSAPCGRPVGRTGQAGEVAIRPVPQRPPGWGYPSSAYSQPLPTSQSLPHTRTSPCPCLCPGTRWRCTRTGKPLSTCVGRCAAGCRRSYCLDAGGGCVGALRRQSGVGQHTAECPGTAAARGKQSAANSPQGYAAGRSTEPGGRRREHFWIRRRIVPDTGAQCAYQTRAQLQQPPSAEGRRM